MQCFQIKQEIVQVFSMLNPHLKWGAGGSYPPPLKVLKMHYFDVAMPRNIIEKKRIQVKGESKKMSWLLKEAGIQNSKS